MKTAYLFPGQGSQRAGMGKDAYEKFPEAREIFDRADAALGFPLSRLCFEGPEEELKLTANTQPAILTTSVALLAALRARLPAETPAAPAFAAGHSLGEYSAHVVAGTISFEDAVRAVRLRGEAMQKACPEGEGAMAAILGLDAAKVATLCEEEAKGDVLSPANFNAAEQTVVAGARAAVERLAAAATAAGAKRAVMLPVSAPFHCALMKPAQDAMRGALAKIQFREGKFPVVANATARPVASGEEARRLLIEQVTSPVRWTDTVALLHAEGVARVVEIGPGRVLTGLQKRAYREIACVNVEDAEGILNFEL